jgi:NADH-quinone oxidoreductase subunit J
MDAELIVFVILAAASLLGALAVIVPPFGRNPLHAAVALLATFSALAGLMVLLAAHLVAVLQVLVYAGAVMVLFIFVILLLNLRREDFGAFKATPWKVVGAAAVVALSVKLGIALSASLAPLDADAPPALQAGFGQVREVGGDLLMNYLVPFEATSFLLLVAIIGALAVARRRDGGAA